MNDRYILILGAGLMQRPSIEAAKELGYKALVIDANPDAVCVPFADRFEKIDLKDTNAIVDFSLSLGKIFARFLQPEQIFQLQFLLLAKNADLFLTVLNLL